MVTNLNKNLISIAIIAALIGVGVGVGVTMIYLKGTEKPAGLLEEAGPAAGVQPEESPEEALAKCLSEKGAKFYGAYWCGWCNKQKELFGEAVQYLPYIECMDKTNNQLTSQCQEAGITGFPTWEFEGKKNSGFKTLEELAELSGCQL